MLKKYKIYLKKLDEDLHKYFESQKEFIVCRCGCSICCSNSYFAASEVEYDLLRDGFNKLDESLKQVIQQDALQILKDRREFLKTNSDIFSFKYVCPFLKNDACSVYEYRPLLCRVHGLIYRDVAKEHKIHLPYCVNEGLNYANIWDKDKNILSKSKRIELGLKAGPEVFDLSYSSLMNNAKDVNFGDVRMVIEWIIFDIPNYQELIGE